MPFPKPTLIPTSELIVDDIKDLKEKLFKSGVAVLKLPISQEDRNTALDKTRFYRTANCIFKDEFQIKEPTLEEKLNPKLIRRVIAASAPQRSSNPMSEVR